MIELIQGDITEFPADAIVNAANTKLINAGGVAAAIEKAAGRRFAQACILMDELNVGDVAVTTAGDLPASWVIHAVGPRYGIDEPSDQLLASAYRRAIEVADDFDCDTLAFPSLSTGIFGYPLELAAPIAITTVLNTPHTLRQISFVLFDEPTLQAYEQALEKSRSLS